LVDVGDAAELELPSGMLVTGTVRQLSPVLDANTRSGIAFVALDGVNADRARSGMYANGTIRVGESPGVALPSSALVQRDGFEYVFVVDDERAHARQVKVRSNRRVGNRIEIVEGVSAADRVVKTGGAFLTDGARVRIVPGDALMLGGGE
jgi:multidrug efflux pump subunit AcrA (membrane-fusion protein)